MLKHFLIQNYIKNSNKIYFTGYASSVYGQTGASSVYGAPAYKYDNSFSVKEEIYSGSKSLYTKSPPAPRVVNLNRSQSVYSRPPPPRTDNYTRNITGSQNIISKSPASVGFTSLSQADTLYSKNNSRQDTLYVTNKAGIVKPEPVYGMSTNTSGYGTKNDSGDSSYSTYRGSGSYASSRSSGPNHSVALSRSRTDALTPNSVMSVNSGLQTPNSTISYHSPNPQY